MSLRRTHQRLRVGCRASGPRSAGHRHPPLDRGAPVIQRPPPATLLGSPVAPAPPSEPEHVPEHVTPPTQPDEPRQPEPAVAVVPGREAAQDVIVRNEAPAESRPSSGGATGDRVASGTGQGGGGRATPDVGTTGQGPGGAGGAGIAPSGPAGGAPGAEYGGYLASVRRRI